MYSKVIFSIPLKAKKNSLDWGYVLKSLERTVKSIEQQSVKEYLIYIATNDPDEVQEVFGSSVVCIKADFDLPSHGWNRPSADKHKKRRLIASEIKKKWLLEDCYIMFLDADDLVHKDLVKYILEQATTGTSYVVDRGFAMDVGNRRIVEVDEFASICGSCFIGYYENEELPLPTSDSLAIDADSTGNIFSRSLRIVVLKRHVQKVSTVMQLSLSLQ